MLEKVTSSKNMKVKQRANWSIDIQGTNIKDDESKGSDHS
jgi:hypothetical protein